MFPDIPKNPLNISYFCRRNTDFESLSQNFQNFLAVVSVEEEDSGTSTLPATAILENCCFSPSSDMEYIFSGGKPLNWIVSGIVLGSVSSK